MSLSPNANTFSMYKSIVCIKLVCYYNGVSMDPTSMKFLCILDCFNSDLNKICCYFSNGRKKQSNNRSANRAPRAAATRRDARTVRCGICHDPWDGDCHATDFR